MNTIIRTELGDHIQYTLNGQLHRINGPARIWSNGDMHWCKNGLLHREDGPAIVWSNGDMAWYQNGRLTSKHGQLIRPF